jgi:hypothetical protein
MLKRMEDISIDSFTVAFVLHKHSKDEAKMLLLPQ